MGRGCFLSTAAGAAWVQQLEESREDTVLQQAGPAAAEAHLAERTAPAAAVAARRNFVEPDFT